MKIAILYSHLKELGGAERVILKQLDMLHKKGHDAECFFAYLDKNLRKETANPHCFTKRLSATKGDWTKKCFYLVKDTKKCLII